MTRLHWKFDSAQSEIKFDPSLRKATSLMRLVVHGLNSFLQQDGITEGELRNTQLFFSSLHGEIEPTLSFLKGIAEKDLARPFLFQNSLHHSTTGFASQRFKILGPSYSFCAIENAQREVLTTGLMMARDSGGSALFIHGESFPEEFSISTGYSPVASCEILFLDQEFMKALTGTNMYNSFADLMTEANEQTQ